MIAAPLFVAKEGDTKNWGTFKFDQLPSPGDRINVTDSRGRVQRLQVTYVAHEPLSEEQQSEADRYSSFVHAEWLDEFY